MTAAPRISYATPHPIVDVQSRPDVRGVALDAAGVRDIRCPIVVLDREQGQQVTIATVSLSVSLPPEVKGTHMSRFVEVLGRHRGELTARTIPALLEDVRTTLRAEHASVEVSFPYFINRSAPASGATALMDYACTFRGATSGEGLDFVMEVAVPVTSLCPCSKEISEYGAHNQRGHITIELRFTAGSDPREWLWIEDLVEIAEDSASAPVYPILKRVDERHVTMQAYDNPVFVEDMVRNAATRLQLDTRVRWFRVTAVNQESIHNHNAYARTEWSRPESDN
jgi:GTP cyclohydrolase IB